MEDEALIHPSPQVEIWGKKQPTIMMVEDEDYGPILSRNLGLRLNTGTALVLDHTAQDLYLNIPNIYVYIIDINLHGKYAGLDVIENIVNHIKNAYVIALSAHSDQEENAIEKGANIFLNKAGHRKISQKISEIYEQIKKERIVEEPITTLRRIENTKYTNGTVINLSDDSVTVELMVDEEVVIREFPRIRFEKKDLAVEGMPISYLVTTYEDGEVNSMIEKRVIENATGEWKERYKDRKRIKDNK